MSGATLYGVCGAVLVGLGLFGLIAHALPLRKILAFNLIGSGVFFAIRGRRPQRRRSRARQ